MASLYGCRPRAVCSQSDKGAGSAESGRVDAGLVGDGSFGAGFEVFELVGDRPEAGLPATDVLENASGDGFDAVLTRLLISRWASVSRSPSWSRNASSRMVRMAWPCSSPKTGRRGWRC